MTMTAPQTRIDPLHAFMAGKSAAASPMPLVATRFDVIIEAGLAIVTTTRVFRNYEASSIEATLTFPVPVHATLFALQARIGDRVLQARAKRKALTCPSSQGGRSVGQCLPADTQAVVVPQLLDAPLLRDLRPVRRSGAERRVRRNALVERLADVAEQRLLVGALVGNAQAHDRVDHARVNERLL